MIRSGSALLALLVSGLAAASEVELRHGEDALDHGNPDWRETSLRLDWSAGGATAIGIASSRIERFGYVDYGFVAGARATVRRWDLGLEGGASATHRVIPAWIAGARVHRALRGGFGAWGGLRWSRYEGDVVSTDVALGNLGVEWYRGRHRFAWTTYVARVEGTWTSSHAVGWDLFFRARDRVGVVLSAGRELESLGGGRVLATDTIGVAVLGRAAIDGSWSLTYGTEFQRMGDLYSRAGGRIGVLREF